MTVRRVTPRHRLSVASRLLAATAGSYAVAILAAIAGAWALPMARADAAATGTIAALLGMPVAAMGCFWARTAARAWIGILGFAALFAMVAAAGGWRP